MRRTRRAWLRALAAGGVAGLAGCADGTDGGPAGATETATSGPRERTATETDSPTADTDGGPATATGESTTANGETPTTDAATATDREYETTTVTVRTPEGKRLGRVTAWIAATPDQKYLGLSDTASMPDDRGMLFPYDREQQLTFVMRRMSFGLDIVYADADGRITRIRSAPEPGPNENGEDQRYPGRGQYVLEVNVGWTDERGVSVGDVLEFSL